MKIILSAFIAVCLSGCVTQPVFNEYQAPKMAQRPKVFEQMSAQRSVAKPTTTLIVAPPLNPVFLAWDYPLDALTWVEYFKVYHSPDLSKYWKSWELYGTTTGLGMVVNPTNVMDFFYCTAYGFGTESGPNIK
jgi:hypothetical protein